LVTGTNDRICGESPMKKNDLNVIHESVEEHSRIFRDLLLGFVKVHVLYHASRQPIYGSGIMAELGRHGYTLSPGTLYPLLHGLEAANFLKRNDKVVEGKVRKYYRITSLGQRALDDARLKVIDLVREIMDGAEEVAPKATKRGRSPDDARQKIHDLVDELMGDRTG
jgi:PadR family transcriptional regulator, regulatory protein PadR